MFYYLNFYLPNVRQWTIFLKCTDLEWLGVVGIFSKFTVKHVSN